MSVRRKLVAIVGPTATGKSALGIRLARALGAEIVSADAYQVYRYLDIGTAKPSREERAQVPHHMIDIADPDQVPGLAAYLDLARAALEDIWRRGGLPIVVGGSGQYVWALLEGWQVPRLPPDEDLRRQLEERAASEGPESLYRELVDVDPAGAARIEPHNVRRVVRALEVYYRTGQPISACQTRQPPDCDMTIIGLTSPRDELYRRIDERVDRMIEQGLVEEVSHLLARGYSPTLPALSSIGYRQICRHLAGDYDLAAAVSEIKSETHRLARMQYNWFKLSDRRIRWLPAGGDSFAEAEVLARQITVEPGASPTARLAREK